MTAITSDSARGALQDIHTCLRQEKSHVQKDKDGQTGRPRLFLTSFDYLSQ